MKTDKQISYFRAITGLLYRAIGFRCLKAAGAAAKPTVVSLAVTNRCNSRCIMCNIWKRAQEQPGIKGLEMSADEITGLLSQPLMSELVELDLTGGETHLRDDLADIALGAAGLKERYLPRLRSIIIASNGLLPRRIISNYRKILEGLQGTGIDLVSVNSLDGIGETHDAIRGVPGSFEKVTETLGGLLELRKEYPNFAAGIKTTILPQNADMLDAILDFALERGLFHVISPAFFTETRFRNMDKSESLSLEDAAHREVMEFLGRDELQTNYFYPEALRFTATGRKRWACGALYNYLFIDFDGKVYPCELLSETIGDVRKQPLEEIWNGPAAREWRRKIGKTECCRECIEPGAIRYSAYAEGCSYLRFLTKLGRHKFRESLYGEGFIKYFGE